MATEEQKYLSDIIKNTHATLRQEAQNCGPEIAWKRHICRKDILQKYAFSMQKLATTYWMENNLNTKNSTYSRIEWIKTQCEEYFLNGGRQKYDLKEENIKQKIDKYYVDSEIPINYNVNIKNKKIQTSEYFDKNNEKLVEKISLLDVGSCYNPFGILDMFDVFAIDLNDIPEKVLRCDFLNVQIGRETLISNDKYQVLQLPEKNFQVVVFSLFLEYLPCPKQRYICCKKAYDLLQTGGILFIISPDSKHVGANAKIIKSWRYVLSKLGFMRIKYEKLRHIHCMIFRKCMFKNVAIRWATLQKLPQNDPLYLNDISIYIPQDLRNVFDEIKERKKEEYDTNEIMSMFNELPFQ
ncbi:S-adenosylmethionine sensor upstream of mTORC1 [Apis florea]|uniref:S-adenosylmethionine sensor upstream of mTORC1 n=1 Tax=Apis florea TaxID=7463 RepID=UPI000252B71A|nr:S-adenosylmethionine sensor upstream of mTORC1 [Apis florea]